MRRFFYTSDTPVTSLALYCLFLKKFGNHDLIDFYTIGLAHGSVVNIFSLKSVRIN